MKKTAVVIGGRPQIVKAFPLIREMQKQKVQFVIIDSNQHYSKDLKNNNFEALGIPRPDFTFKPLHKSSAFQIAYFIKSFTDIFQDTGITSVVVFGDMTTTLAAAIAANKAKKFLIHIEAGIRSGARQMEEEINRILVDHLSNALITPNDIATNNLIKENIGQLPAPMTAQTQHIFVLGDIMRDSLFLALKDAKKQKMSEKDFVLLTLHRAENVDSEKELRSKIDFIYNNFQDKKVLFPVHPRTHKKMREFNIKLPKNFVILKPQNYLRSVLLMQNSSLVATDSGGMQKEACWLGKPCIILRDETEWPVLIDQKRAVIYTNYSNGFRFHPVREIGQSQVASKIVKIIKKVEAL